MLSCTCFDYDGERWYYYPPGDFKPFAKKRRKKCCSCNKFIEKNAECIAFPRYRNPLSDIEERIKGDEIRLADYFMCEKCGEIYLNLTDLNYCIILGDNMFDLLKEYWDLTGFQHS